MQVIKKEFVQAVYLRFHISQRLYLVHRRPCLCGWLRPPHLLGDDHLVEQEPHLEEEKT